MDVARWPRLSLAWRFALASAAVLLAGAAILGLWVTREIETSVVRRVAADSSLYVEALLEPHVPALARGTLTPAERLSLGTVLGSASISRSVVSAKIWAPDGTILYATDPRLVGMRLQSDGLAAALTGHVTSERSDLRHAESAYERSIAPELIETYIPLRIGPDERVVAVAEFYQLPDLLEVDLQRARLSTWAVIAVATLAMYVALAGMVGAGSRTIERQRVALEATVTRLSATTRRLRDVSAARVETDEANLRRVARELHDGLAQDLAAALLSLERGPDGSAPQVVRAAIDSALSEVRSLARGLALPDLAPLSLGGVVEQACADHERKTGRAVECDVGPLPPEAEPTVKITIYRVLQEALSNAFRHAPGASARVSAARQGDAIHLECVDTGPGIAASSGGEGLGLRSMRERIELLGGTWEIGRAVGGGTRVTCTLPVGR